ncbi:substrate-binding domain-containing protein [Ponticoccus litoralis]|uniref:Substrate-binding domain-containing protein n=1 Tax=Ponticoccus litoralis TaxID=422297 RepID=A0AAW9STZ5_9RHOB
MMYNSGMDVKGDISGINYFGSDEFVAGEAGGRYMAEQGAQKILCHIHTPGAVNHEARCGGVEKGGTEAGAEVVILRTPANLDGDITGLAEAIKSELVADQSFDAVISLSASSADASTNAVQQIGAGDRVMVGAFDLSEAALNRIRGGHPEDGHRPAALSARLSRHLDAGRAYRLRHRAGHRSGADRPRHRRCLEHRNRTGRGLCGRPLIR